jgi:hypothetical protein
MAKTKPVQFFCTQCGKEIWEKMPREVKAKLTIREAEETAVCSYCYMAHIFGFQPKVTNKELSI